MKYPFKFLDAYDRSDKDIFFGREEEIEALYKMVFQTNLMLVYGASGTGKTSLIRCGLANKFKPSQWLDLYIRREGNINTSLLENIKNKTPKAVTATVEDDEDDWFEALIDENESKSSLPRNLGESESSLSRNLGENRVAAALNDLYLATFTPIYLIFDQFEEVFTIGTEAEQKELVETIKVLVQLQLPVKIIIAIREEYLAKLYDLEKAIPQLRNKRLRIEPMNFDRVEKVILNATNHDLTNENANKNANIFLEKGKEKEIAEAIVNKIREGDVDIQLPYLQVFMDRLYEEATNEPITRTKTATFTLKLVNRLGKIGDVLVDFLNRQTQVIQEQLRIKHKDLPDDIVWKILSPFATAEGTKKPIQQNNFDLIQESLKNNNVTIPNFSTFIKDAITELEGSRILRFRRESQTYEVYHDTLAKQIAEKRSEDEKAYLKAKRIVTDGFAMYGDTKTLLGKEQLAFVKPYEKRIKKEAPSTTDYLSKSENKLKKQRHATIAVMTILVLIGSYIVFDTQKRNAELEMKNILIRNEQEKTKAEQEKTQKALNQFLEEQRKRETKELTQLIQDAQTIVKIGDNCPPDNMIYTIDSLYKKYKNPIYQENYEKMMGKLKAVKCLD